MAVLVPVPVSLVPELTTFTFSDGRVAAWGPNNAFLVTTPNATFIPEIVEAGIVAVYLRDNGAFGKHDPIQWPQMYASQYPYLAAIPKRPPPDAQPGSSQPCPHSAIWDDPSDDDFLIIPNTPVSGFGRLRLHFLARLEPLIQDMSAKAREYVPPWSTFDALPLRHYGRAMAQGWERLCIMSATLRDQALQLSAVRRYWLLCSAFITFYDRFCRDPCAEPLDVDPGLMGAWTTDPGVVQTLLPMGIPVWFVRARHLVSSRARVVSFIGISSADALCHDVFNGVDVVYRGLAGTRHLEATFKSHMELICRSRGDGTNASGYRDRTRMPRAFTQDSSPSDSLAHPIPISLNAPSALSSPTLPNGMPSRTPNYKNKTRYRPMPYDRLAHDRSRAAHPSQVRGRDKFIDVAHAWMPPALPSWERAMRAVDRSDKARPGRWGYWIPEPGLLLGPKSPARLQTYVMNWLRARPAWLYMLQTPDSASTAKLQTQIWRDFLHGVPDEPNGHTKNGKRAHTIKQIFGRVFAEGQLQDGVRGDAEWRGRRVAAVDDALGPLVIWETFELGFRYELLALDRAMRPGGRTPDEETDRVALLARVFPSDSLFSVLRLPPAADAPSLFAPLPHRRVGALNALRDVLAQWPLCPPEIKAGPLRISDGVERILELELRLACFYTQVFFDVAGRAPIVPHCYPFPSHVE